MTVTVSYWTWWFSSWIYPARNWWLFPLLCKRLPEGKPPLSYNSPMVFLWFSHENLHFPMVFPWKPPFSYGFPMKTSIFLGFSYGFPMKTSLFLWFSHENLHFPMVFLWFSHENLHFPMVFQKMPLLSIGSSGHPIPWSKGIQGATSQSCQEDDAGAASLRRKRNW